jgi:RNA polymerase sigma-70 factor, ECF subfamily
MGFFSLPRAPHRAAGAPGASPPSGARPEGSLSAPTLGPEHPLAPSRTPPNVGGIGGIEGIGAEAGDGSAEKAPPAAQRHVARKGPPATVDAQPSKPVYRGEMLELVYSRRQTSPWAEVSDRDLLLALRGGDETALDALIGRKTKPLLQLVSRILGDMEEARDVVQVTFFKVWENRSKFDERWSPNTWIYRIASNLAIDHLRARRSRERSHEPVRQHLRQVADGRAHRDLSRVQQTEVAAIFRELAAKLSEKQRMVFLLREVEGMSSPEVAQILGCRESTVRNHLFNARRYLRAELVRRYPEYAANHAEAVTSGPLSPVADEKEARS